MSQIASIAGSAWAIDVWPELGGALVAARAHHAGSWLDITRPADAAAIAARDIRGLGGFVLAPFCNRLEGGRFTYAGEDHHVPPNWPPDPVIAIHGLAWERPWTVEDRAESRIELGQHFAEDGAAFKYAARLVYDVSGDAAVTTLSIRNTGPQTMPFGLGFHPYFRRTPGATVRFDANGWLEPDSRCFPIAWHSIDTVKDASNGLPADALEGIDATFTSWTRQAALAWPELGARLLIDASPAAKALHIYVPRADNGFLCLEPVTHVIDVLNRREFARYGDMVPLAPGAELTLSMRWRLEAIADAP